MNHEYFINAIDEAISKGVRKGIIFFQEENRSGQPIEKDVPGLSRPEIPGGEGDRDTCYSGTDEGGG